MKSMNIDLILLPLRNYILYLILRNELKLSDLNGVFFNRKFLPKEKFLTEVGLPSAVHSLTVQTVKEHVDLVTNEVDAIFEQLSYYYNQEVYGVGLVDYKFISDVIFGTKYFPKERR